MPRTHQDSADQGAELEVAACPADQRAGSWSVAAGWALVQLDWSLRQRERRHGSRRFVARIPAMYARVRQLVRVVFMRGRDVDPLRATPPDP